MKSKNEKREVALIATLLCAALAVSQNVSAAADMKEAAMVMTEAAAEEPTDSEDSPAAAGGEKTAEAEKPTDWQGTTITGDWDGARQRLSDAGVQADLQFTADYLRDTAGGQRRGGAYVGHADVILRFDGRKLIGWEGGSGYLHLISNSGHRANLNYVGSLMGVDNLEAPVNRSGVFKAWLQQSFLDDKASVRVGLYPIDTEFYVTDSSGIFLHPSFGMAAEAANFGSLSGPSIYATSSHGARLRIEPDPAWYGMLAVTRGVPSDRIASAGPNVSWRNSNGGMTVAEVGFSPAKAFAERGAAASAGDDYEPISKLALGAWRYAPRFSQLAAVDAAGDPLRGSHWGAYFLAEQTVYRVPESARDLTAFVRYGFTDGRTSTLGYSFSVGLSSRGTFAEREKDSFGIAATRAHADPQGRQQLSDDLGTLSSNDETALEVTYRAQVAAGVAVQPVLQRIWRPNFSLPNATVAGVRLQLAF
ncbi:MAG TPA: carbohydrate porin [Accumulibacter sp.]|jgi:porin|nr:carbohydrate porin [Accumulibacter sp.]HQC81200.1 carbohydrate porin [Accumulibacter sp.]